MCIELGVHTTQAFLTYFSLTYYLPSSTYPHVQLSWEWLYKVFKGWLWFYFKKWQGMVFNHRIIMRVMCRSHEHSFSKSNKLLQNGFAQFYSNTENKKVHKCVADHTNKKKIWICNSLWIKFIYSEKPKHFCEIFPLLLTVCTVSSQKYGEDFAKFCGLLRIYEL